MKTHSPTGRSRGVFDSALIPSAVFLFAFILRFLYIYQFREDVSSKCLSVDPQYYHNWAMEILQGNVLGSAVFEQTPLYAYLLAFTYRFITTDLFFVRLLQIIVGSASAVILYKITKDLLESRLMGFIAGIMAAIYGPFIFYDGMIMKPFLEVFFVLLMTLFLLRPDITRSSRPSLKYPLLAGLSLGLAALLRENVILLIPVVPVWMALVNKDATLGARISGAVFFLIGAVIVIAPITTRNYHLSGEFVLITAGGGEVFYIGNNPEADGTYIEPEFVRPTPTYEHEDFRRKARELTGLDLTRKGSSDFWFAQGIKFIKENPGRFLWLLSRKFIIFWNRVELPDNQNYYFESSRSGVLKGPLLHFGIIAPVGALGMLLALKRGFRRFSMLYIAFFTYLVSVLLFFNFARFRVLAVPFLMVFACLAVSWFVEKARERRIAALGLSLIVLAAFFIGSNHNALGKDATRLKFDTAYANLGACYMRFGRPDDALLAFGKALEINPAYPEAHSGLGDIYYQSGDPARAFDEYSAAVKADPHSEQAFNGLGRIYAERGELDASIRMFKRAVELGPENPAYLANLGFSLMRTGDYANARAVFKKATDGRLGVPNAWFGLAEASERLGERKRAAEYYAKFLETGTDDLMREKAGKRLGALVKGQGK